MKFCHKGSTKILEYFFYKLLNNKYRFDEDRKVIIEQKINDMSLNRRKCISEKFVVSYHY